MREYELVIVLDGKASAAKKKSVEELVEKIVGVFKGKVESSEDWGVKDLAYKIEKSETGAFVIYKLLLEPTYVKQLSEKIKLEDDIIRYLLIKRNSKSK